MIKKGIALALLLGAIFMASCNFSGEPLTEEQKNHYMDLGERTVQNAGATLVAELSKALNEGGVEAAIPFCKVNAQNILDEVAGAEGLNQVRRSTMKYRNKNNKATASDETIFKVYEYALNRGDSIKPILQIDADRDEVLYYSPIYIQPTCMKCHGNKDEGYTQENFDIVNKHYPKDRAFNYSVGDMRGMWVIHMKDVHSK